MCGTVWIVRYGMVFIVWYDRLINAHVTKLLFLIAYLLWLVVCVSVLLFLFLPACLHFHLCECTSEHVAVAVADALSAHISASVVHEDWVYRLPIHHLSHCTSYTSSLTSPTRLPVSFPLLTLHPCLHPSRIRATTLLPIPTTASLHSPSLDYPSSHP